VKARLVVLASGNGSNLQALIDACAQGRLPAQVVAVVSNQPEAQALQRAVQVGIETAVLPLRLPRADYDAELAARVQGFAPDLVVLAGWMLLLGERFLQPFPGRVVNLHPALPGALPGKDSIRRAWQACRDGQLQHTGVMVHEVVLAVDAGPVLASEVVPLIPGEPLEALEVRVHEVEHRLIVQGVATALKRRKKT
jgi:phosphoribosylglycinamide formyltransferase-1